MNEQTERRGPGRPPKYHEVVGANTQQAVAPVVDVSAVVETGLPNRPTRKPFGMLEQKLSYPAREGFHRHWFNDTPGRVQRAQEAGYEHVKDDEGKNVCRIVGSAEGGGALNGYLMEIPEEWYKQDMAAQQKEVDAKEATMRRGELEKQAGDGRYVPAQGISINHGK